MKANELMIGDWVRKLEPGGHTIPVKVTGIIDEDNSVLFERRDGVHGVTDIKAFEPIPLTGEILGKNGFVHRQSVTWGDVFTYTYAIVQKDKVLQYEQHFNLSPNPYDGSGFYWIPEMSAVSALRVVYVHELQHLLRLCGIEKDIIEL